MFNELTTSTWKDHRKPIEFIRVHKPTKTTYKEQSKYHVGALIDAIPVTSRVRTETFLFLSSSVPSKSIATNLYISTTIYSSIWCVAQPAWLWKEVGLYPANRTEKRRQKQLQMHWLMDEIRWMPSAGLGRAAAGEERYSSIEVKQGSSTFDWKQCYLLRTIIQEIFENEGNTVGTLRGFIPFWNDGVPSCWIQWHNDIGWTVCLWLYCWHVTLEFF